MLPFIHLFFIFTVHFLYILLYKNKNADLQTRVRLLVSSPSQHRPWIPWTYMPLIRCAYHAGWLWLLVFAGRVVIFRADTTALEPHVPYHVPTPCHIYALYPKSADCMVFAWIIPCRIAVRICSVSQLIRSQLASRLRRRYFTAVVSNT